MSAYTIRRGDNLSTLAQRFHTSVGALMGANKQIKNPNLIYAGAKLNIPGSKDTFEPHSGSRSGGGSRGAAPQSGTHGGSRAGNAAPVSQSVPGQVGQWIAQAQGILKAAGVPMDKMNAKDIATIIQHESGGNPNAQNNWDSNAAAGHPSIGLMQTIGPTFNSYKLAGHDNIRNPVDNIIAGVRYAISRYGSISNVPGVRAVNSGGSYVGY